MKEKIAQLLILLFESKMKKYDEKTIDIWIELLKDYPIDALEQAIHKLIYTKDDFVSVGQIHEMINPPENIDEKAYIEWSNIVYVSGGRKGNVDPVASKCFHRISSYDEYGYLTDDFRKNQIKTQFLRLYKDTLKRGNNSIELLKGDKNGNLLSCLRQIKKEV